MDEDMRALVAGLSGVNRTMLLTLQARARHTLSPRPRFRDEAAVRISARLRQEAPHLDRVPLDRLTSDGVVLRTIVLDDLVGGFIATHPGCTVLTLACGLDTRFHRLDDGLLAWYDLDLPAVAALRRRLLPAHERVRLIAASALDPAWPQQVDPLHLGRPVLVVIEGLTMYLRTEELRALMDLLARHLPGSTVLVEVVPRLFARHGRQRSVRATGARLTYGSRGTGDFLATIAPGYTLLHEVPHTRTIARLRPWTGPVVDLPGVAGLSPRILVLRAPAMTARGHSHQSTRGARGPRRARREPEGAEDLRADGT